MNSLKDMREKLLKEITEQLDAKVHEKVSLTLNQTNNASDMYATNAS